MPPARRRPLPICYCGICNMNLIRTEQQIEEMIANLDPLIAATPWADNDGAAPVGPVVFVDNWFPLTPAQVRIYMESILLVLCGHVFHKSCIRKYAYQSLLLRGPTACPICDRPFNVFADEIRLFPTLDILIGDEDRVRFVRPGWKLIKHFRRAYNYGRYLLQYGTLAYLFWTAGLRASRIYEKTIAAANDDDTLTLPIQPLGFDLLKILLILAYLMIDRDFDILEYIATKILNL